MEYSLVHGHLSIYLYRCCMIFLCFLIFILSSYCPGQRMQLLLLLVMVLLPVDPLPFFCQNTTTSLHYLLRSVLAFPFPFFPFSISLFPLSHPYTPFFYLPLPLQTIFSYHSVFPFKSLCLSFLSFPSFHSSVVG